jgi:hypothetical protein
MIYRSALPANMGMAGRTVIALTYVTASVHTLNIETGEFPYTSDERKFAGHPSPF